MFKLNDKSVSLRPGQADERYEGQYVEKQAFNGSILPLLFWRPELIRIDKKKCGKFLRLEAEPLFTFCERVEGWGLHPGPREQLAFSMFSFVNIQRFFAGQLLATLGAGLHPAVLAPVVIIQRFFAGQLLATLSAGLLPAVLAPVVSIQRFFAGQLLATLEQVCSPLCLFRL